MTRSCSKCGNRHERTGRYCFACHAAYMRKWRKTHAMSDGQRKRDASRSFANVYKKRGVLKPQPCCICGSHSAEMHHPDHEQPLKVTWLCRDHHLEWHEISRTKVLELFAFWVADQANVFHETKVSKPAKLRSAA